MKLYVLVRNDLSTSHQAVQAGHAVAEYMMKRKDKTWNNGTLVYLKVPSEFSLQIWQKKLKGLDIDVYPFYEGYWNNSLTAMAVCHPEAEDLFKNLKLL